MALAATAHGVSEGASGSVFPSSHPQRKHRIRRLAGSGVFQSAMSGYDDNNGWGDDVGHGYHKSSLRKDQIENLANRTDIDEEEKGRRRKKLEEEIAAGVVGGGILGYAGYHHHEKHEVKEGEQGEHKHHHFGL